MLPQSRKFVVAASRIFWLGCSGKSVVLVRFGALYLTGPWSKAR